jgi:hypothetical protein
VITAAAILCAPAAGCGDAVEKCRGARESAALAWTEYVAALERARGLAQATQVDANDKLSGEVELRLSPVAQKQADARYDRSSEAWSRAHTIALNDACARDAECSALRRRNAEAKNAMADLDERLPAARAAQAAARGPVDEAARTSAAVLGHPEYPQLAKAKELGANAAELCADVPAAAQSPSAQ